jgi:hypothetical protein
MKYSFISMIIFFLFSSCMLNQSIKIEKKYLEQADSNGKENVDSLGHEVKNIFFKAKKDIYAANTKYYSPKFVLSIKGYLLEKNYACNFNFTSEGELHEFKFSLGDNKHYSYKIMWENGLYFEEGTPLVDYWPSNIHQKADIMDSAEILFSYFPRKNIDVQYSTDGKNYQPFVIKKSNLLPFVMKGRLLSPNKYPAIYFITEANNPILRLTGLISNRRFYDTLRIHSE